MSSFAAARLIASAIGTGTPKFKASEISAARFFASIASLHLRAKRRIDVRFYTQNLMMRYSFQRSELEKVEGLMYLNSRKFLLMIYVILSNEVASAGYACDV